ncbi:MAG: cohesin domain-containing protein [Archaeoglobaceae archaeon]
MKKLILLIFLFFTVTAQEVYLSYREVNLGEVFSVQVYANAKNATGLNFTVEFDPEIISLIDVKLNSSFNCTKDCFWFKNNGSNFVKVVIVGSNFIGPLVDLVFEAKNVGSTELKISAGMSDENFSFFVPKVTGSRVLVVERRINTVTTTPFVQTTPQDVQSAEIEIKDSSSATIESTTAIDSSKSDEISNRAEIKQNENQEGEFNVKEELNVAKEMDESKNAEFDGNLYIYVFAICIGIGVLYVWSRIR